MSEPKVYTSSGEHLDDELAWLATRAKRLGVDRRLRERDLDSTPVSDTVVGEQEAVLDAELGRRVVALRERETALRTEIDRRLEATRKEQGDRALGLDRLTAEFGLSPEERLVLLVTLPPCIGDEAAQASISEVAGSYYTSPTCEVAITLIGATDVEERVRLRKLFQPGAPLIRHGLLSCDFHKRDKNPEALLDARIALTQKGFALMVGTHALDVQ